MNRTNLSGNIDTDKLTPFIKIAQDIHIQGLLGTKLYDKILNGIEDGTISTAYEDFTIKYVKPVLIHYAVADLLAFHAYSVDNGGIFKHSSDTGEVVTKDEVDKIVKKQRDIGDHYRSFLVRHLQLHPENFPEYTDYQEEGIYPSGNYNGWTGWVL